MQGPLLPGACCAAGSVRYPNRFVRSTFSTKLQTQTAKTKIRYSIYLSRLDVDTVLYLSIYLGLQRETSLFRSLFDEVTDTKREDNVELSDSIVIQFSTELQIAETKRNFTFLHLTPLRFLAHLHVCSVVSMLHVAYSYICTSRSFLTSETVLPIRLSIYVVPH